MPSQLEDEVVVTEASPSAPTAVPPRKEPARTKPRDQADTKPKRQPPYAVILHNDDVNSFEFVIATLMKVFGYSTTKAFRLTLTAHMRGKAAVWSGMREHAELKADQIKSRGPDPMMMHKGAAPLRASIEPQA